MGVFRLWFLYLTAFIANILIFSGGSSFTWTSPMISKLTHTDPVHNPLGIPIKTVHTSWITSLLFLGCTLGPVANALLVDWLGRKKTMLIIAIPIIVGYMMLAFVTIIELYYVARFIMGLGVGSSFAILPMYLGEIAEDNNRGLLGCIMTVFLTLGILYSFVVGPFLSVKVFTLSCAVPLVIFLILFFLFFPETPVYLAIVGDTEKGRNALKKLRNSDDVDKELSELTKMLQEEKGQKGGIKEILTTVGLRNGLIVSMGLVMFQQFSGINAVLAFLGPIFEATGAGISPYLSTVILGGLQTMCTIVTAAVVEKLGRRPLLLFSTIGSGVSIIFLGIYFFLKDKEICDVTSIFWLPVASFVLYIIAFNFGLAPLPWTMMGELFPAYARSVGATITTSTCFLASFVITLGFPLLQESLGKAQCFWIFGIFCFLGTAFTYFLVPETKGKSINEIQQILNRE